MNRNLVFLLLSVTLASAGQILLKIGASRAKVLLDFVNPAVVSGLFCYGVSTLLWVWVLSRLPLSTVYAFTTLTLVVVYLCSWLLLGEKISLQTTIGLAFILLGLALISFDART